MSSQAKHVLLTSIHSTANEVVHVAHRSDRHVQNCVPAVIAELLGCGTMKATQASRASPVKASARPPLSATQAAPLAGYESTCPGNTMLFPFLGA
jgi:hypothetical protein